MNHKMIWRTTGHIVLLEAALLALPLAVALAAREWRTAIAFCTAIGAALLLGLLLSLTARGADKLIFAREGFVTVALSWVLLSLIGAVPFTVAGYTGGGAISYVDALFETASGLSTTGASVLVPENLSRGLLFWRSFTHWIGGMGVLVLIMAIFPADSGRSIHVMRAEMPGPVVGKLVPRLRDTAKILYLIYIAMTLLETALLAFGGMPLFESVLHAFGTAGTGGFGVYSSSITEYSPYIQWVITVFMLLFGVNFNLYYLMLIRRAKEALRSTELRFYLIIVLAASALIVWNIFPLVSTFGEAVRLSVFQVASFLTTTGYATANANLWPEFSRALLLLLMFLGGCAGSTAGGLKLSRVMILWQSVRRSFRQMLHPRAVSAAHHEGKPLDDKMLSSVSAYFVLYCLILAVLTLLLSLLAPAGFDFEMNFSAAVSCFNNIGPAFTHAGDPGAMFAQYGIAEKLLLTAAMLLGRLEIYPLLFAFSPSTWTGKKS